MAPAEDGEAIGLLDNSCEDATSVNDEEGIINSNTKNIVTLLDAFYIMVGFGLGTGVLIISYTVRQLGIVLWVFLLTLVISVQCSCSYLLHLCTRKVIEDRNGQELVRDPFQVVAEIAGGFILRKFSTVIMYASDVSACISLLLVASSFLATCIPIGGFIQANVTRIWITIIISVLTPIMYLGTYSELKIPALVAIVTSVTSAVIVISNCVIYRYVRPSEDVTDSAEPVLIDHNPFVSIGSLIFMTTVAHTVPNVTVLSSAPKKLYRSIVSCYSSMLFVFFLTALVPYYIFEGEVSSSILSTFNDLIKRNETGVTFTVLTVVIQVLMLVHLCMASILAMNPIFLHLEETLNVPRELNWKRVMVRTTCMVIILGICLAIPQFEFAVGIAGGVPFTFLAILLPAFMYTKIFEVNIYKKILIYLFMTLVFVFIFGNLYFSIRTLVVN